MGSGTLYAESGLIAGYAYGTGLHATAVEFGDSGDGTLVVSPKARFDGNISGNSSVSDVLDLAAGKTLGTLTGIGTTVTGFSTIAIGNGAAWAVTGSLTGSGEVTIGAQATLQFYGSATESISLSSGGDATLLLGNPTQVTSTFSGFGTGDKIDLIGITATSLSYSSGTLTLLGSGGQTVDTLHFSGDYTQSDFSLQALNNGTAVVYAGAKASAFNEQDWFNHVAGFMHLPF